MKKFLKVFVWTTLTFSVVLSPIVPAGVALAQDDDDDDSINIIPLVLVFAGVGTTAPQSAVLRGFAIADLDQNGSLDVREVEALRQRVLALQSAKQDARLGILRNLDVATRFAALDDDKDGAIAYTDFAKRLRAPVTK